MIPQHIKIVTASILSLVFSLMAVLPSRGQMPTSRRGQQHRVGRVVLPTPPFNPDAGILTSPKTRRRASIKTKPQRRTIKRRGKAANGKPRMVTPRKHRVR